MAPNEETRRKKRKKKRIKETPVDEFSRIRKHLRYLLHRWTYEQNLIDAYSGEGWKGQRFVIYSLFTLKILEHFPLMAMWLSF